VKDHLTKVPQNSGQQKHKRLSTREFFCLSCNAKVTVGQTNVEYGHGGGCDHRPESFPHARPTGHRKTSGKI